MGVEEDVSAGPAVLAVSQLCKSYGALKAVNNLSFSVKAGQCFGLLGPNGAGKTTTLEMLEGIIKPDSGAIFYQGDIASRRHFQQLGVQFQQNGVAGLSHRRRNLTDVCRFLSESGEHKRAYSAL